MKPLEPDAQEALRSRRQRREERSTSLRSSPKTRTPQAAAAQNARFVCRASPHSATQHTAEVRAGPAAIRHGKTGGWYSSVRAKSHSMNSTTGRWTRSCRKV